MATLKTLCLLDDTNGTFCLVRWADTETILRRSLKHARLSSHEGGNGRDALVSSIKFGQLLKSAQRSSAAI